MLGYQNSLDEANAAKLTCRSFNQEVPWAIGNIYLADLFNSMTWTFLKIGHKQLCAIVNRD